MLNAESIEDLLELFASMHSSEVSIKPNSSDVTIMYSIARATFKGTALTDRQFALMQTKLETYRDQFESQGVDFSSCIGVTRQPLREIDRRKFIKMLSTEQAEKLRLDDTTDWFVIRLALILDILLFDYLWQTCSSPYCFQPIILCFYHIIWHQSFIPKHSCISVS